MNKKRIIGYDLSKNNIQISYWDTGMNEPETIYLNEVDDSMNIPCKLLFYKSDNHFSIDNIYDADAVIIDDILNKAINNETVFLDREYKAEELLKEFILLSLKRVYDVNSNYGDVYISFTLDKIDKIINIISNVASEIGIDKDKIYIQDYKESYFDYICSQKKEIWTYGSVLYEIKDEKIYSYKMKKIRLVGNKKKELMIIEDYVSDNLLTAQNKDKLFADFINKSIDKDLVTSVFLIGKEFEGDWFPESLKILCKGRRVFGGYNLYSKGACYGAMRKIGLTSYDVIYIDNHKITSDIDVLVKENGKASWLNIASQGENWYEINHSIEVIIDQATYIPIRITKFGDNESREEKILLDGLFEKQRRATRLKINIIFLSKYMGKITINDTDFGDILKANGYYLEHLLTLEKGDIFE